MYKTIDESIELVNLLKRSLVVLRMTCEAILFLIVFFHFFKLSINNAIRFALLA